MVQRAPHARRGPRPSARLAHHLKDAGLRLGAGVVRPAAAQRARRVEARPAVAVDRARRATVTAGPVHRARRPSATATAGPPLAAVLLARGATGTATAAGQPAVAVHRDPRRKPGGSQGARPRVRNAAARGDRDPTGRLYGLAAASGSWGQVLGWRRRVPLSSTPTILHSRWWKPSKV